MELNMIVEVPKGSRNKYELDPALGRIRLNCMLFTATRYPTDYGYIPDTLAEDGDPLDAMVLLHEPTFPGCQIRIRSVGVFWMRDEAGPDAKILTVSATDPRFAQMHDLGDVPEHQLAEIGHFFGVYKDLEPGKDTDVRGWQNRVAADEEIERALARSAARS
ncbi:MAG: inorganic diphosphatase [Kineosporiaceae bacterium]